MKTYNMGHRCPQCDQDLEDTEVLQTDWVSGDALRLTLAGHVVTFDGLRPSIQCIPVFDLPKWVDENEFRADFDRVAETIRAQVRSGHGKYRVYARYQVYSQPTETGKIRTAKEYMGICVDSTRSLYHGNCRDKVGEVTL